MQTTTELTTSDLISLIARHIRENGVNTHTAKSSFGSDTYLLDDVKALLMDEGSTWVISSKDVKVYQTMTRTPVYQIGDEKALKSIAERFSLITGANATPVAPPSPVTPMDSNQPSASLTLTRFGGTEEQEPAYALVNIEQATAIRIMDAIKYMKGSKTKYELSLCASIPEYRNEDDSPYAFEMARAHYNICFNGSVRVDSHFKYVFDVIESEIDIVPIEELVNQAPDHALTTSLLEERYSRLNKTTDCPEHAEYCRQDWQLEAGVGNTQLGYWEWVLNQLETEIAA